MFLLLFLLGIILLISVRVISIARAKYGTLEGCGFPVLSPTLLLGSVPGFYKQVQHEEDIVRAKVYGTIWGLYEGRDPQVFICDSALVKQICVKDFEYFHSRRVLNLGPIATNILDQLQGDTWKFMRTRLNSLFTSYKLKIMGESIDSYVKEINEELIATCMERGSVTIDCAKTVSSWFLNISTRAMLGTEVEGSKDPDNPFVSAFREMMGEHVQENFIHSLVYSFPILESLFSRILDDKSQVLIEGMLRKMLADRRGIPRNNDLADILNELRERLDEEELREKGITEGVVIAQALAMLVGGYDPTHANVIHLLYFLAINPEAQARLQAEILRTHPNARRLGLTYESIQDSNLPYLVACMKEAVRMCPSVFRPERICNRDWSYGGYRIRKGTVVRVATFGLHFNPNYFPDPYNYRPERFLEGSTTTTVVPYSYVPFGYGPRTCIGMRFANESTKIFMINLLSCFTIKARPDAKLVYKPGKTILAYLKEPLYLDLEPRI